MDVNKSVIIINLDIITSLSASFNFLSYSYFSFELCRAKGFKLDEIRRILEIMSTNRVENEEEVAKLSQLLLQADITTKDEGYENLMNRVRV